MKKPVEELTESQLRKEIEKHQKLDSINCDSLIAAGRGHETRRDARKQTDPLSVESSRLGDILFDLYSEERRRMRYHGSLKRIIKKMA